MTEGKIALFVEQKTNFRIQIYVNDIPIYSCFLFGSPKNTQVYYEITVISFQLP